MAYLSVTLNHFRAIQSWANQSGAQVNLDAKTFDLEVKFRNRYYLLKPKFLLIHDGKMIYATALSKSVVGFIGWMPYDILQWAISQDKLLAKEFFKKEGLNIPATWLSSHEVAGDYLLKRSAGSFGYQVAGPFRHDRKVNTLESVAEAEGLRSVQFAEQFVYGTNLKVWFWGDKAIYAQHHVYPVIIGDGVSTVQALVRALCVDAGVRAISVNDQNNINAALDFQQVQWELVLDKGRSVWIDFRYGRQYTHDPNKAETDNDLAKLDAQVRHQIDMIGVKVSEEAMRKFKAPVLYSVDGVVDAEHRIWWLEINSNPMLPPEGYPHIFASLFGPTQ